MARARIFLAAGFVAAACGGADDTGDPLECGPGTVAEGSQCVPASAGTSHGGKGNGAAGTASQGGKAQSGSASSEGGAPSAGSGDVPVSGGSSGSSGGGGSNGGSVSTDAGAPNGGTPDTNAGAGGMPNMSGGPGGEGGMESTGGAAGMAGAGGEGPTGGVKSLGCGKAFAGTSGAKVTIQTSGTKDTKCADSKCGAWSYARDYYVYLPANYDKTHAYDLVFEGPGCGGNGSQVYNLDDSVIRIGLTPPPNTIGHSTYPNQGCFDDHEGDDSVDYVFYENLFDELEGELCFDKSRVFAAGDSTGSFFANSLACKYAGDPARPIRAVLANTGGLITTPPAWATTCNKAPVAGMWVHEIGETEMPFSRTKDAIDRAMKVNGCSIGTSYATAQFENYPIGGGNSDTTCQKIKGCPDLYPLVVCALLGNQHAPHAGVVNPGFSTFIKNLPPL